MNNKEKFLLIADLNSSYTIQFIENVLAPLDFDIYIPRRINNLKDETKQLITKLNIKIIKYYEKEDCLLFKIPKLGLRIRELLNILNILKVKDIRFVHIQYVTKIDLFTAFAAKSKRIKRFASFWGSDLLRQEESYLKEEKKYLDKLDYISADSYMMESRYNEVFYNAKNKLDIIYYGVSLIDYIKKLDSDIENCKSSFGFPQNKKVIAIGYNAIKQQQHDKVLEALASIENKNDYYLVFQMTYGCLSDKDYLPRLLNAIEKSGFEYRIIKDFLSMDDLAKLRIATDIFINAQTTDAFCNSIKEHMYAKTQVISATWLHYPEIDMFPLYLNEFSEFSEIPKLLNQTISNEKLEWNKKIINEKSTWEACRNKWAEIYGVNNK